MDGSGEEEEAWVEVAPLEFARGAERHLCGARCALARVVLAGGECCPVSRLHVGSVVADAETQEKDVDAPARGRGGVGDPLDVNGDLNMRRAAEAVYAKLFAASMATSPGCKAEIRAALVEAKARGVDVAREGKEIAAEVRAAHVTAADFRATTDAAMRLMPVVQRANTRKRKKLPFEAVVCAVLSYQSTHGLRYQSRCIVAPSAKMKRLLPRPRAFAKLGVDSSLIKKGMNAIMAVMPEVAALHFGAADVAPPPAMEIPAGRKRLKL